MAPMAPCCIYQVFRQFRSPSQCHSVHVRTHVAMHGRGTRLGVRYLGVNYDLPIPGRPSSRFYYISIGWKRRNRSFIYSMGALRPMTNKLEAVRLLKRVHECILLLLIAIGGSTSSRAYQPYKAQEELFKRRSCNRSCNQLSQLQLG